MNKLQSACARKVSDSIAASTLRRCYMFASFCGIRAARRAGFQFGTVCNFFAGFKPWRDGRHIFTSFTLKSKNDGAICWAT